MDSDHTVNKVPSVSPIPTTLKRKRGPSLSGDPPSGKPVLKQSKDAAADALADLDELEELDEEDYDSDSSGKILRYVPAYIHVLTPLSIFNSPRRRGCNQAPCQTPRNRTT